MHESRLLMLTSLINLPQWLHSACFQAREPDFPLTLIQSLRESIKLDFVIIIETKGLTLSWAPLCCFTVSNACIAVQMSNPVTKQQTCQRQTVTRSIAFVWLTFLRRPPGARAQFSQILQRPEPSRCLSGYPGWRHSLTSCEFNAF